MGLSRLALGLSLFFVAEPTAQRRERGGETRRVSAQDLPQGRLLRRVAHVRRLVRLQPHLQSSSSDRVAIKWRSSSNQVATRRVEGQAWL